MQEILIILLSLSIIISIITIVIIEIFKRKILRSSLETYLEIKELLTKEQFQEWRLSYLISENWKYLYEIEKLIKKDSGVK